MNIVHKYFFIFAILLLALVACREKEGSSNNSNIAKPSNLQIQILSSSSVKLTWTDNSTNESGFKIYRNNIFLKQISANQESFTDTNLDKKIYQYGVSTVDASSESIRVSISIDLREDPKPGITCKIFPETNTWNKDISDLPVHPNSDNYINSIAADTKLHPDFGTVWNNAPNGIPYNIVDKNTPKQNVVFKYADESDAGPYPIPESPKIEGGVNSDGDRHIILLDKDDCKLYELFNAFPPNSPQNGNKRNWQAGSGAIFDLNSNKLRPNGWTSADAAGLAIFPGLVRYEEAVTEGEIKHALRFTVKQTQKAYIHPATHYASNSTDANLPPMGLRLRLKKEYDISSFSAEVQVILTALKKYGMFLADNGGDMFISGVPNPKWNDDHLAELKQVPASAFEAVYTGNIVGQDDAQWLPKAVIKLSSESSEINKSINYDGSASYDADGTIESYKWFFGDGFEASGKTVNHSYQNSGRFMVRLDVTDNDALVSTKVIPIIITNKSPNASEEIEYVLDPSFESGKLNFTDYYQKAKLKISSTKPISGQKSLNIIFDDWSSAVLAISYPWQAGPKAKKLTISTKLRINSASENSTIEVCVQSFSFENDKEIEQESCEAIKANEKETVSLSPSLTLDPNKNLSRIYFYINFSHTGQADISIDDSHLILEAIKGSGGNPE